MPYRLRQAARARLALISLPLLAAFACGPAADPEPAAPRPVRTIEVLATGGERVRSFAGSAQASVESRLSFKVGGTLQRLAVSVGDTVSAGQLIAQIDPRDLELQVEDAEASLARAEAEARRAAAEYARTRQLYEDRNVGSRDLESARANNTAARTNVSSATKRLEIARRQLDYARLSAPQKGQISSVSVEVNENVQVGQTVAVLTAGAQPEVNVAVPEQFIRFIREGDRALAHFDAVPDTNFEARVTEVGVAAGSGATTFPVTVRLENAEGRVRPGMAAEVDFRFTVGEGRERILVPPAAVGEDRDGRFVFIVEVGEGGAATARRRPVRTGELSGEGLEVLEGLADGELLVTAGVTRIYDGQEVRLMTPGSVS